MFVFLFQFTLLGVILKNAFLPNYAKEVAVPIEKALVEKGAVKVKSGGDNGRGIDSRTPYYGATFIVPLNEDVAVELSKTITKDNGFYLSHATLENPGIINVADNFINNWYYDNTSREANYSNLDKGKIELKWEVNVENADTNLGQTSIRFDIKLPQFKE